MLGLARDRAVRRSKLIRSHCKRDPCRTTPRHAGRAGRVHHPHPGGAQRAQRGGAVAGEHRRRPLCRPARHHGARSPCPGVSDADGARPDVGRRHGRRHLLVGGACARPRRPRRRQRRRRARDRHCARHGRPVRRRVRGIRPFHLWRTGRQRRRARSRRWLLQGAFHRLLRALDRQLRGLDPARHRRHAHAGPRLARHRRRCRSRSPAP